MKHLRTTKDDRGFTMLEALIAGAILTIALMGLAGFQAASFSRNAESKEKTVVTNFGVEMVERIQSNRQRVLDYHNVDTTASTPCPQTTTAQRQALADCQQWRTALTASGVNGVRGVVTANRVDPDPTTGVPSLNRTDVVVTVTWNASVAGGTSVQSKSATFRTIIAPE
jgi:type IV pilus assembly protein PilV